MVDAQSEPDSAPAADHVPVVDFPVQTQMKLYRAERSRHILRRAPRSSSRADRRHKTKAAPGPGAHHLAIA